MEGCVRPSPRQTIDRDALVRRLEQYAEECGVGEDDPTPGAASDILALLRPVDGVTLSRVEASITADWYDWIVDQGGDVPAPERALAERLRAEALA